MSLSIIIPCYNEEATIYKICTKVNDVLFKANIEYEIIIINDGSKDQSESEINKLNFKMIYSYQKNQGKGNAVQNGIKLSSKKYILVQDADLEYDPNDIPKLYSLINSDKLVIYGTRLVSESGKYRYPKNYAVTSFVASIFLSILHYILYRVIITDTLTGYKLYPKTFFTNNVIISKGFETDHEITGLLIKQKYRILESPIKFYPRTIAEGKKIGIFDFFIAIQTIFKTWKK